MSRQEQVQLKVNARLAESVVQGYINQKIKALGYDNENSIAKYLVVGNPFYEECKTISLWIGDVWVKVAEIQTEVLSGTRNITTAEELLLELPELIV